MYFPYQHCSLGILVVAATVLQVVSVPGFPTVRVTHLEQTGSSPHGEHALNGNVASLCIPRKHWHIRSKKSALTPPGILNIFTSCENATGKLGPSSFSLPLLWRLLAAGCDLVSPSVPEWPAGRAMPGFPNPRGALKSS